VGLKSDHAPSTLPAGGDPAVAGAPSRPPTPPEVVWHDIECGGYHADLALWHELAERAGEPVLDIGAGSGRVALELARAGHAVTALDSSAPLLAALAERARGLPIETVRADARSFSLARDDYALCIVPMQTIQLLGGRSARVGFLRRARAHLRPGATLACAILGELEPFDCSGGGVGPAAERASVDGSLYLSRALRVAETSRGVVIERERRILSEHEPAPAWPFERAGDAAGEPQRDLVELDLVTVAMLGGEGAEAGLRQQPARVLAATDEHVASSVVMFRA